MLTSKKIIRTIEKIILARLVWFSLVRLSVLQKTVGHRVSALLSFSILQKTVGHRLSALLSFSVLQKTVGHRVSALLSFSVLQKSVRDGGTSSYLDLLALYQRQWNGGMERGIIPKGAARMPCDMAANEISAAMFFMVAKTVESNGWW